MSGLPVTPLDVEERLRRLGAELDTAHDEMVEAEATYYTAKGTYEIAVARARINVGQESSDMGVRLTVQEREDMATLRTADQLTALYTAEAVVKAARANINRLRTQVDIARSVSVNVRTAITL